MDLIARLKNASDGLYKAEEAMQPPYSVSSEPVPDWVLSHMPTLGIAVAIVGYFTPKQIEAMVALDVAHRSTIEGGSLDIARSVYNSYLKRENEAKVRSLLKENEALWRQRGICPNHNYILDGLSRDNLEQLHRVCTTAGKIVEHKFF